MSIASFLWRWVVVISLIGVSLFAGLLIYGMATFLVVPVLLVIVAWNVTQARRRAQRSVIAYVEQAVRLNHPLPATLRAAADSERAGVAAPLREISDALETGASLGQAMHRAAPAVSTRCSALIAVAERTGTLRQTLAYLREPAPSDDRSESGDAVGLIMLEALALVTIAVAVTAFVAPVNASIVAEYGIARASWTDVPIYDIATGLMMFALCVWGVLTIAAGSLIVFGDFLGPIGRQSRDALRGICGGLWLRDRALADAMGAIAGAIEAGLPLASAVGEATQVEPGGLVGRRLRAWSDAMSSGETPAAAARKAKLPAMVTGVLAVGESGGDLLASIGYLQRYYDRRFHRSVELLRGAVVPVGVLVLGAFVLLVTYELLSPIWLTIEHTIATGGAL